DDNVEDLQIFSKYVDWNRFLQSCDVKNVWLNCSNEFTLPGGLISGKHPYPTNPFFVAMFFNAQKCLIFMMESGVDFSKLRERGVSAYHVLFSAIHFMSIRRCPDAPLAKYSELITLFHCTLFTRDQQSSMIKSVCQNGMTPLSWGVYIGLPDQVEYVIYYFSPNCTVHSESLGINEHITMDVSDVTGEDPSFFTSPLSVMLDIYGESTLPELKRLGIFRKGYLWKHWVDLMFKRNRVVIFFYLLLAILLTVITVFFTGSSGNDYIKSNNATTSRSDTFPDFLAAFYQTFLVSLNIVDTTIFRPADDRIDLNVTHLFYVLFVPILFINFVVGILSSVVSQQSKTRFAMKHKNSILPKLDTPEMIECPYNILDFLPTNEDWLAFVKCLAEDNVEDLEVFSRHINWKQFLQSRDTGGVWLECSPQFASTVAMCNNVHPFPTNPFFIAMFYNAQKCLIYMNESGVDFSSIVEHGLNAYHHLFGALSFSSKRRLETGSKTEIFDLVCLFHRVLFTQKQHTVMLNSRSVAGMSPLSWGVYLGLANYVEYVIYYFSPNCLVKSEAIGITEHITMDVSELVGENPCYFTSPICILLDLYGESTLPELKKIGIFRHNFIWKQWVDLLFESNKMFLYTILFVGVLLTVFTVVFTGSILNDYIKFRCAGVNTDTPIGTVVVLSVWLAYTSLGTFSMLYGVVRKEYIRPDTIPQFLAAFYETFLVSLNIVNTTIFVPKNDRIDL
uniref:Ion_trans domain-containing protein n=1 Tax=Macrostomum lignano TaxID=282301 RepID=A0A1I8H738_9PLAT